MLHRNSRAILLSVITVTMRDFEKTFAFEPTPDQHKCFEAVENDMVWRSRPMDRLVCGDVGFGKTEIALCCPQRVCWLRSI